MKKDQLTAEVNAAIRKLIARNKNNDKYRCAESLCGREFTREGDCKRHILTKHKNLVLLHSVKIREQWEQQAEKWEKEYAVKEGDNYFDYVEASLKDALREVQRCRKRYNETEEVKEKADSISFCIHHLTANLQTRSYEGVNAIRRLMEAHSKAD